VTTASETVGRAPSRRRRRPRWISGVLAAAMTLVWIFPVYWMVITAFKPRRGVLSATPHFWPTDPTLHNFVIAFTSAGFLDDLRNSVVVVGGAVLLSIFLAFLASAALTRYRFRGRRTSMVLILIIQMLPQTALIVPMFLIFTDLALVGTYWGLILAYVALVLPFSIWVLRGFFLIIPKELEEAAAVDGAGSWRVLWSVLFPLVLPGMISTSVFALITAWNDYIFAFTFMKDQTMYTLPVWLASFSTPTGTDYGSQMAGSVLFSAPVVIFFLIVQRRLVTGVAAGAVKG